jgi:glycosyltransferase involved in cell wall biosynthesis
LRIALVLNDNFSMWHFRKGLIRTLCQEGHDVFTVTPDGPFVKQLESLGAKHRSVPMNRFVGPLADVAMVWHLFWTFRRERIDLVHNMTVKPTIYGAVAARLAGVPKTVALVSGIGLPFMDGGGWRRRALRIAVTAMYRLAFALTDKVWFQNPDDVSFFVSLGLLSHEKTVLIRGSGVNVDEFDAAMVDAEALTGLRRELGIGPDTTTLMMVVARLIWSKGIKEFVETAALLVEECPDARFCLVGPFDPGHPDAIPFEYLEKMKSRNLFIHTKFRQDVRELLAVADIVVLPSYFREGVPRVLLEALSLGKPIVTTDHPGCRETVDNGINGWLVAPRDSKALAGSLIPLIADGDMRRRFGQSSRRKAEREFDEHDVVGGVLTRLYGLDARQVPQANVHSAHV